VDLAAERLDPERPGHVAEAEESLAGGRAEPDPYESSLEEDFLEQARGKLDPENLREWDQAVQETGTAKRRADAFAEAVSCIIEATL
jgi:hypothetical protein